MGQAAVKRLIMLKYVIKRLLWLIPVILGVCIFIFAIMYFVPGDPASIILGPSATASELAAKRTELGLDQPFIIRLLTYMKNVFLHFRMIGLFIFGGCHTYIYTYTHGCTINE